MKRDIMMTITSLLTLVLLVFHLTDDVMHGYERGGLMNLIAVVTVPVLWLCGALLLSGRRSGYVIMLLGGLLSVYVAYVHMGGRGVGGEFAKTSGAFFFVWTLMMLAATGAFSAVLSLRGLWNTWARPASVSISTAPGQL